jgi:uncharacterized damage-inducible protein DinB
MIDKDFMEHFDQVTRVSCRAVRMIPPDKLDMKPTPEMMSAKDLAGHMFVSEQVMMKGARTGEILQEDFAEAGRLVGSMKTPEEIAAYGEKVHAETNAWFKGAAEADYTKPVRAFWGMTMTPEMCVTSSYEHMVHHRGQLYVYLRLIGLVPPDQYSQE